MKEFGQETAAKLEVRAQDLKGKQVETDSDRGRLKYFVEVSWKTLKGDSVRHSFLVFNLSSSAVLICYTSSVQFEASEQTTQQYHVVIGFCAPFLFNQ